MWPNKLVSKQFHNFFLTVILPTKSCKNNSKTLFLHCIGLYLIFTIWRLDLQRRPTKFGRAYAFFFSSLHIKMNGSLITCHFKHFNLICYVMLCYFMLFHFISFHFISFHFISFHFISFHFISFHFISFHFILFYFIVYCYLYRNLTAEFCQENLVKI